MTRALAPDKKSLLSGLLGSRQPSATGMLEAEKSRLEAFLSAFPGEYCGWAEDGGGVAYSPGFCIILGIESLKTIDDVTVRLSPGDGAALEGLFDRLAHDGVTFTIVVKSHDEKRVFKFSGSRGQDLRGQALYNVLWVEDVTELTIAEELFTQDARQKERGLAEMTTALNAIPRPLWLRDENQKITWCNDTYAEFLNTTRDRVLRDQKEIAAQTAKKRAASNAKEKDEVLPGPDLARAALQSGKTLDTLAHAVVKGVRILLRVTEIPLPPLPLTLGLAYNITREEELETDLRRHQSSNRELLGQLRTAIAIYSADERLEFYNHAFSQLWALEEKWLNAQPRLGDVMEKLRETRRLPEQADFRRFKQSWLDMFTGLIDPYEDMLHLPDGSALRMLVVPHSMGGLMMTFEDVSSRLELESSYNTLIAVQKETLDNLGEAVAVYGGNGRLKLWNPAFGRLWNLNPEDLEGEPHVTTIADKTKPFFTKEEWPARREALVAKGLDRVMYEGRLARIDGSLVDYSTVPLPDGGVLITYADVTDTVRVEKALREKNAALEAAEQLKLDFLANVSYQLRTPLTAIMGFNDILRNEYFGKLNPRQKAYTGDINNASEKLLGLINDILDLSTLEAGYMSLERDTVDVKSMLQDVLNLVTGWAQKEQIDITLDVAKNTGSIEGDALRLQQAVINLVRNSIAFTPRGGKIALSAHKDEKGVYIVVRDTGIGISGEDKDRVFAPFERGQGRTGRIGAGLGLTLVKNIISLHSGAITMDSEPDKGTTVTMFLPFPGFKL